MIYERLPSAESPGKVEIIKHRDLSWSATYQCKRCGYAWSQEGRSERRS